MNVCENILLYRFYDDLALPISPPAGQSFGSGGVCLDDKHQISHAFLLILGQLQQHLHVVH